MTFHLKVESSLRPRDPVRLPMALQQFQAIKLGRHNRGFKCTAAAAGRVRDLKVETKSKWCGEWLKNGHGNNECEWLHAETEDRLKDTIMKWFDKMRVIMSDNGSNAM